MKIAILSPVFWTFDGISRAVEDQAREFASAGHEVAIFTLAANMEAVDGVPLYTLGMPGSNTAQRIYRLLFPLDFLKAIRYVPKLKDFDVIYSHQYPMNWLAYLAKKKYGIRYVYYNHGVGIAEIFPNLKERVYMKVLAWMANWTIRRADSGVSISQYISRELKKQTGLDSEVVYRQADKIRFHKGIDGSRIRHQYNLRDSPTILFVGRISPHKGVHLLIEAFKLVRQEIPDARLLIVGRHSFPAYSKMITELSDESIVITGDVSDEDLPYFYAACDVYATATMWEGFDLPVAEAQACGKPVVAFDIGPHKEIIDKDGTLVPVCNVVEMAKSIAKTMERLSAVKL